MRARGFTLIEVMIVLAIAAILAVIAFSSYSTQMQKSRRAEAKAALLAAAGQLERYYTERNTYATATLGSGGVYPDHTENSYYTLTLTGLTATGYTLSAVPAAIQAADKCGTLTYTAQGTKGVTGTVSVSDCW